ncbi:hypothetical protein C8D76_11061 [Pasteurella langaaensis DSM 22999]|uniref:Uncharacterized protein n=1 Tax=Alitibacter langaaensis DSM 22999 TaxID=1122935 RepID=A0A2U0SNW5_9PAST|nr:hypothetical protein [Pasteurella langaaensis]PVX33034.1 hypothetical protein C8D76_11061 [Pasteurella langaaensis DSM 22999]
MKDIIEIILNSLEKIENEANVSQDEITKALEKIFTAIETAGNDESDILDNILYHQLNNKNIKDGIFYFLDILERVFINSLNTKNKFMANDLALIFPDKNELLNEVDQRSKFDVRNERLFLLIKTFLKAKINELYAYSNATPKADRITKGKTKKGADVD